MDASADILLDSTGPEAPAAPRSIAETGLSAGFLLDLLIKTVAMQGMERASRMAAAMKLPIGVVQDVVEIAKSKQLLILLGQPGANMSAEMRYQLSDKGRAWAERALTQSTWTGPAPVPIQQFVAQIQRQSIRNEKLTEDALRDVFRELTLPQELMSRIGPAVNSGASILLYGPPGNGKSTIAQAVCEAFRDVVYVPHALVIGPDVIVFFDPVVHRPVAVEPQTAVADSLRRPPARDERYVPCLRPYVISGGELSVEKFEIVRNADTKLYDAPLQMKAAGGLFVLDDFGRQRHAPQEFINRLILPLESGVDHLVMQSGRKIEVPLDTLLIFATNFEPRSLLDEAGLRRLRHKILIERPDRRAFVKILVRAARRAGLALDADTIAYILVDLYGKTPSARFNAFHPQFLIDQCRSICAYEGTPATMTQDVLAQAWENLVAAH